MIVFSHAGHFSLTISCLFPQKRHCLIVLLSCDLLHASGFRSFFRRHEDLVSLLRWELLDNLFTDSVGLLEAISFICELFASVLRQTSIHFSSVSLCSWNSWCLDVCFLRTPNTILSLSMNHTEFQSCKSLLNFVKLWYKHQFRRSPPDFYYWTCSVQMSRL